jgi:hypothetical protein
MGGGWAPRVALDSPGRPRGLAAQASAGLVIREIGSAKKRVMPGVLTRERAGGKRRRLDKWPCKCHIAFDFDKMAKNDASRLDFRKDPFAFGSLAALDGGAGDGARRRGCAFAPRRAA